MNEAKDSSKFQPLLLRLRLAPLDMDMRRALSCQYMQEIFYLCPATKPGQMNNDNQLPTILQLHFSLFLNFSSKHSHVLHIKLPHK